MTRVLAGIALATLSAAAACGPCADTAQCHVSSRVVANGQIVRTLDGRGVDGVRMDVRRSGGITLGRDSTSVTTDNGGFWRIELPASGSGTAVLDFTVHSPTLEQPYTVSGVQLSTTDRGGDAHVLDRWIDTPYYPIYAQPFLRGTDYQTIPGVVIQFHRTSGVQLTGGGWINDTYTAASDSSGRVQLFVYNGKPKTFGPVIGDMVVVLPAPYRPDTIRNVVVTPTYVYRAAAGIMTVPVGPSFDYAIRLYNRATGAPVPGVQMDFQRTAGPQLSTNSFTMTSDASGYIQVHPQVLADGVVSADITLRPPPPGGPRVLHVQLPTYQDDVRRAIGDYFLEPYLPYFGVVYGNGGLPVPNVAVTVTRTGGAAVSPNSFTTTTNATGNVLFNPVPQALGSVTFDLTFHPPAPYPSFVVHNVTVAVEDQDVPFGHLVWVWNLNKTIDGPPGSTVEMLP